MVLPRHTRRRAATHAAHVAVAASLLSLCWSPTAWAQTDSAPKFRDFAGNASHTGTPAPIQLNTAEARNYRTRLRAASQQPANFAGDHVLTTWGCGMNCVTGAAVSLRTGAVTFLPGSVCCWKAEDDKVTFRADSRLLVLAGLMNEEGTHGAHFYEFTGHSFRHIQTTPVKDPWDTTAPTPAAAKPSPRKPSASGPSHWIKLAESDTSVWHVKPGSFAFSTTKGGTAIALVVGQVTNLSTSRISVQKWYVSGPDCRRKMGSLVTLNVNDQFEYESDFVFGSSSVASALAESICAAAAQQTRSANDAKGI